MIHEREGFLQRWVNGPAVDEIDYRTLRIVQFSYCAAASLVAWETLITLCDEVRYIWTKPNNASAKWLFLFAKWFGFAHQIIIFVAFTVLSDNAPIPSAACQAFHFYQAGALISLYMNLDILLLLRVHALYKRDLKCTAFAIVLLTIQFASSILADFVALSKARDNAACIIVSVPVFCLVGVIAMGVSQVIFVFMAFRKRSIASQGKQGNLIWIVIRDSLMVFGALGGLVLLSLVYILSGQAMGNVLYPWFPALPSILVARLIINMQKAVDPVMTVVEFTTLPVESGHSGPTAFLDVPPDTQVTEC